MWKAHGSRKGTKELDGHLKNGPRDLPTFFRKPTWLVAVKHPDVKFGFAYTRQQKRMASFDARGEELQRFFLKNQIEIGVLGVRVAKTGVLLFDGRNPAAVDMENIPFS